MTLGDMRRHLGQGIPLGLQFSVLAIGIIVMQSVVVKFDILEGEMISNAAQNGFGAANKLNNLLMTPMNGLGTAMTSYTAQNMAPGSRSASKRERCRRWRWYPILAGISIAIGLGLSFGGSYLRIFLSVDKVTAETMRYGNTIYMWIWRCISFWGSSLWCATVCRASGFRGLSWGQVPRSFWPGWRCACCCRRHLRAGR